MTIEELIAEHTAKTQDILKLRARADKLAEQMAEAQREASDAEARVQRVEKEIINALREKALKQIAHTDKPCPACGPGLGHNRVNQGGPGTAPITGWD